MVGHTDALACCFWELHLEIEQVPCDLRLTYPLAIGAGYPGPDLHVRSRGFERAVVERDSTGGRARGMYPGGGAQHGIAQACRCPGGLWIAKGTRHPLKPQLIPILHPRIALNSLINWASKTCERLSGAMLFGGGQKRRLSTPI